MKIAITLLFLVSTLLTNTETIQQETQTVTATYMGSSNGEFYFVEGKNKMVFQAVDSKVTETVNLGDEKLKGKTFEITYTTEEEEAEDGEIIEILTIKTLKPKM